MGASVSVFTREETGAKNPFNDTELELGLSSVDHSTLETQDHCFFLIRDALHLCTFSLLPPHY